MVFNKMLKELEKSTNSSCEIQLKFINNKTKIEVYGDLKERAIEVIPLKVKNFNTLQDLKILKGKYKNRKKLEDKAFTLCALGCPNIVRQLNNRYHILEDGIYLTTPGIHVGFAEGKGEKVAKIRYEMFK